MPKGSGKVGIGTTTPGAKLDVVGTIAASYLQMNPQNDKGEGGEIQLLGSGGAGNINIDNYYGNLRIFGLATDKQLQVSGKATINGNTMISGDLTVDTSTLYVDSTNNRVGIGTISPGEQLAVSGNATISGNLAVDTSTLYVDSANNRVGIGTVSPETTLDVKGKTVVQSYLLVGQTSPTGYQNVTADSNDLIVNGQFAAGGSGGSAIYKLGIGYAPPSQGEGTLIVSGKVGIGTTNPQANLHVAGSMRLGATELTETELAILKKLANSQLKVLIKTENGKILDHYRQRADSGDNDRTIQFRSNTAADDNTKMTLVITD